MFRCIPSFHEASAVSQGQWCIKQEIKQHINKPQQNNTQKPKPKQNNKETATTTKYTTATIPVYFYNIKKKGSAVQCCGTEFAVQCVTAPLPTVLSSAETHTTLRDPLFCSTLDCKIKSGFPPLKTLFVCVCTI